MVTSNKNADDKRYMEWLRDFSKETIDDEIRRLWTGIESSSSSSLIGGRIERPEGGAVRDSAKMRGAFSALTVASEVHDDVSNARRLRRLDESLREAARDEHISSELRDKAHAENKNAPKFASL